ncbi:hypothetical protein NRF20_41540 [Streptomyces sp. R-74717]|uniref:hypothetical protein n=1 Tax=Streptomyces TaxID=1883 RepID=UPI002250267E|nr:hypothetical protein [Streptomyces atratus]MCX5345740.1 hypothetical protein [Streptomyces atratus]
MDGYQSATESVRNAGGAAKVITCSAAAPDAIHAEWDQPAGIPNTSCGVDPSSNRVSVDIYDGAPTADQVPGSKEPPLPTETRCGDPHRQSVALPRMATA